MGVLSDKEMTERNCACSQELDRIFSYYSFEYYTNMLANNPGLQESMVANVGVWPGLLPFPQMLQMAADAVKKFMQPLCRANTRNTAKSITCPLTYPLSVLVE